MTFFYEKKKMTASLLIAALIFTQLLTPILAPYASAQALTVPVLTNPISLKSALSLDTLKSYILNLAVKIAMAVLIRSITNQIISWIQGNDGQNVGFVNNLNQTLRQTADEAGGAFLQQLALTPQPPGCTPGVNCTFNGIDICTANLRSFLRISLRTPGIRQQLGCTLSDIGANAQDFFQDFQQGGWPAFIKIGLEPQNNPYGAYLLALDAKIAAEDAAGRALGAKYQANPSGILGFEVPQDKNCRSIPEDEYYEIKNASGSGGKAWRIRTVDTAPEEDPSFQLCDVEQITKTPGTLISDTLSKAVGSGIDFGVATQEIDGAISAIVTALIQKVITSSSGLFASNGDGDNENQGIFEPELGDLEFDEDDIQNSALQTRLDGFIFTADDALAALNAAIIAAQKDLFAARQEIADLTAQIDDLKKQDPGGADPAIQKQITDLEAEISTLRKTEADAETKLNGQLADQADVIASEEELMEIKDTFVNSTTPGQLADATIEIEPAISRLNQAISSIEDTSSASIPSGNTKTDTRTMLESAEQNVRDEIALFTAMRDEIDRLIANPLTAATQKGLLTGQSSKRTEVAAEITRLNEQLTALVNLDSRLSAAITNDQIRFARQDIINRVLISDRELAAANAAMAKIIPTLKP